MLIKENVVVEIPQVKEKRCDRCNISATSTDFVEWQEFISLDFCGGYGSVFGDGTRVSIDLCQKCFHEVLGQFVRFPDDVIYEDEDDKY